MRNLGIIVSILFLAVGCLTVPPAVSVIDKCKAENFNEYYGDCIFQTYETHPNRDAYLNQYNYRSDWMDITETNKNILSLLAEDKITINSANRVFMVKFNALYQRDVARVAAQDKALQDFTDAMNEIADKNAARAGAMYGNGVVNNTGMTYYLTDNYMSGTNRICIYKLGGQVATHTINGIGMCPISMNF